MPGLPEVRHSFYSSERDSNVREKRYGRVKLWSTSPGQHTRKQLLLLLLIMGAARKEKEGEFSNSLSSTSTIRLMESPNSLPPPT